MKAVILVAHGSRREASNQEVRALAARLHERAAARLGPVSAAFLELASPSIPEAIHEVVTAGAQRILLFPYFLSAGRHVAEDIPAEVAKALQLHPDVGVEIAPYLGAAEGLLDLLLQELERSV